MSHPAPPTFESTTYSTGGLVASVDQLASSAGAQVLSAGGSAADAAIAANAVLAVTAPHMCGIGGDLFALVHHGSGAPEVVDAAGRAGSGADADRLRRAGHRQVPTRGNVAAAPVPGCVDGWVLLHERYGRLPFAQVLDPAIRLARDGFPVSPLLAFMLHTLEPLDGCDELHLARPDTGERLVRPDLARTLVAIAEGGRGAFYEGAFGEGLVAVGGGEYEPTDLQRCQATWTEPLSTRVWGHDVWTPPPTSSGYLVLAGAAIAQRCGLDGDAGLDPDDPAWAHLLVEAARLAGFDRPEVLHDGAQVASMLDENTLRARAAQFSAHSTARLGASTRTADTTYLCVVDRDGMGVSLIQSNAMDFGCHVAVPGTGVLLHNRGLGFSLEAGHPAEYGPGRRPPHTLSPALVTRPDGSLRAVLGTMGGDSQPQVVLQMLARLLVAGQDAGEVITAPRFVLAHRQPRSGFDTWAEPDEQVVRLEAHAPSAWADGLERTGHQIELAGFDPAGFGHAQLIEVREDGVRAGAADPRSMTGAAIAAV